MSPARLQQESEEPEGLTLVLPEEGSVRRAALLWRRWSRRARSPYHRQHWLQQVPRLWLEESLVVLQRAQQQLEPVALEFELKLVLTLTLMVKRPFVWLCFMDNCLLVDGDLWLLAGGCH